MASPISSASYIPLGAIPVLSVEGSTSISPIPAEGEVDATHLLSSCLPTTHPLYSALSTLISQRLVRVGITFNNILRVYFLPDDVGRAQVKYRNNSLAKKRLSELMTQLDVSHSTWSGTPETLTKHYKPPRTRRDSLFYLFNMLPSPHPTPDKISDQFSAEAMLELLDDPTVSSGLKTPLYTYQQRSAAMMIQKESEPQQKLDPRLATLTGPTGKKFYYDWHTNELICSPRWYTDARGGMLAETMGHGKSLITLALIMATQGHIPQRPPPVEYKEDKDETITEKPSGCRTLLEMAAAGIARHNIPWKRHFSDLARRGEHYDTCTDLLQKRFSYYRTSNDNSSATPSRAAQPLERKIHIAPVTLVVVPSSLIPQWEDQIREHVEPGCLSWLTISRIPRGFPSVEELAKYDMILLAKNVFESEINRSDPDYPPVAPTDCTVCKNATRATDANSSTPVKSGPASYCTEHKYWSSLLDIHFLRFIVDEGHDFVSAASATSSSTRALKAIRVERKWLVSGTPSSGLLGAELERAVENGVDPLKGGSLPSTDLKLAQNRSDIDLQEREDIKRLGKIVTEFLGLQPWSNSGTDDKAEWTKYVVPSAKDQVKSTSVGPVLESLVIRHRIEDIEKDLTLPPLTNTITYLDPSFYDRLSLNLFIMVLTVNAITSERADEDYMFHPKNRGSLDALIRNLRHSGFFWSGFSSHDVRQTIKNAQSYLDSPLKNPSVADREALEQAIKIGQAALGNPGWSAFHRSEQIGFYVDHFPRDAEGGWTLSTRMLQTGYAEEWEPPMLVGSSHLPHVQKYINDRLYATNPAEGLAAYANEVKEVLRVSEEREKSESPNKTTPRNTTRNTSKQQPISPPKTIPASSTQAVPKHSAAKFAENKSRPKRSIRSPRKTAASTNGLKSSLKIIVRAPEVPSAWEELSNSELKGTSSTKLSYLMDKCWELHKEEKILIFYEGDDTAYYIAQGLEVLGIPHFIYAAKLDQKLRTSYLHDFNHKPRERVMLMDLRLAAHGLHIATASRVFFVNPVWNPSVEAQAIKRAHRIGQHRPVIAETLVLRGTLEDQLIARSKEMSSAEHKLAARSPLDDKLMADLIRSASFLPIDQKEMESQFLQFAPLKQSQRLFGRDVAEALEEARAQGIPTPTATPVKYRTTTPSRKRKPKFADSPTSSPSKRRKSSSTSAGSPDSVRLETFTPRESPTPAMWSNIRVVIPWVDTTMWDTGVSPPTASNFANANPPSQFSWIA